MYKIIKLLLVLILFLTAEQIMAQKVKGTVYEFVGGDTLALPGANIFWMFQKKLICWFLAL